MEGSNTAAPEELEPNDDTAMSRDSLSQRIYARLRLQLMTGFYEPGQRLNIRGLANTFETSQTPVREAVIQLVREGALELRHGYQPRVPVLTLERYINIRETRVPLERLAGEQAAVHIAPEQIDEMRHFHKLFMEAEAGEDWKAAQVANQKFHFVIYHASNNDILISVIENLWLLVGPFVNNQYPNIRQAASDVHPHLLMIDALMRRSPAEVGELVVRDLREGSYRILQQFKSGQMIPKGSAKRAGRRKASTE